MKKVRINWKSLADGYQSDFLRVEEELLRAIEDRDHHRDLCYKAESNLKVSITRESEKVSHIRFLERNNTQLLEDNLKLRGYVARVREVEANQRRDVDVCPESQSGIRSGPVDHGTMDRGVMIETSPTQGPSLGGSGSGGGRNFERDY